MKNILNIIEKHKLISGILIPLFALIVAIVSVWMNHIISLPKFSLSILPIEDDSNNLNRKFELYNSGGK